MCQQTFLLAHYQCFYPKSINRCDIWKVETEDYVSFGWSCCIIIMLILQINELSVISFYRAMHFSAKRGIAIACRLSVCLSVTLVNCDHIGWNSSKIISPLVSLGC